MQVDVPDPAYHHSADSHERFRGALIVSAIFVAGLMLIHFAGWALGLDLGRFGVHPRDPLGLAGIVAAPLLHGDLTHLVSNVVPLFVGGTALLYLYPDSSRYVLPAVYVGPGILLVWLFGRDSIHIGASGLVYGIVSYVFVAGILRRDRRAWAASVLVALLYGTLVWGVLPIKVGVCRRRLAAAVIGVALAFALRARDIPPRKRYSCEDEPEEEDVDYEATEEGPVPEEQVAGPPPRPLLH